ncbi:polyprenyl synthetase family protein [Chlamydia ibidis]|uniref:Polyprenyl synthetase family protein n=2 Tax=Chlamydia ibidis TaxID=1405396 RepID=S7J3N2_9CHLA|nr:polyprenyl synthetase family protein [Chlamydia ibidis]EPP34632.1 polyprenyl synthetase family protein [Chlamydia ibidis]EQM62941.1 polyprenyl synthetase family protein [Chlamydia ibidis 10-1398/6]
MTIEEVITSYRKQIEEALQDSLNDFGAKGESIREPVEYALMSGGKRIRPIMVCMVAHALGLNRDVIDSALSIEFIHTSTLIADDLPCMDNDDERRGRPTVHKAFDEASALLASYALIPAAYARLRTNAKKLKQRGVHPEDVDTAYDTILDITDRNFGAHGILGGQYDDMFFQNKGSDHVLEIIGKKTGSLFEISCSAGWLFGGGSHTCIPQIVEFSKHFGRIFQIKDDILDIEQDRQDVGLNYALLFGQDKAMQALENSTNSCLAILDALEQYGLKDNSQLKMLIEYMNVRKF